MKTHYALDPALVATWTDAAVHAEVRRGLGRSQGRPLARFPNGAPGWRKLAEDAFCRTAPKDAALLRKAREYFVAVVKHWDGHLEACAAAWRQSLAWLANAEAVDPPFHGIITADGARSSHAAVLTPATICGAAPESPHERWIPAADELHLAETKRRADEVLNGIRSILGPDTERKIAPVLREHEHIFVSYSVKPTSCFLRSKDLALFVTLVFEHVEGLSLGKAGARSVPVLQSAEVKFIVDVRNWKAHAGPPTRWDDRFIRTTMKEGARQIGAHLNLTGLDALVELLLA